MKIFVKMDTFLLERKQREYELLYEEYDTCGITSLIETPSLNFWDDIE